MTTDTQPMTPTDAEIDALWVGQQLTVPQLVLRRVIAHAALAKWGTPPAVAGEPYGYVYTVQVAPIVGDERKVERTVFTRNKPPCASVALYTTPQPTQAQAAVASPLTKLQRKAIAVCFTSDKVSVSEVQRQLSISYADAQTLCQSIVDLGLTDELELAPSLKRGAPASQPAPVAQGDALTDTYVQQVPDKCDRIVWRGRYYHLPIDAAEHSYTEPSPMAKVAAVLTTTPQPPTGGFLFGEQDAKS